MGKLTDRRVRAARTGKHGDGAGLWLVVKRSGARSWVLRYQLDGRAREMGLGPYPLVGLAAARERAQALRAGLRQGIDPLEAQSAPQAPTFAQAAAAYLRAHRRRWVPMHARRWAALFRLYAGPIRNTPVDRIGVPEALALLDPLWGRLRSAERLRLNAEAVLDAATVRGWREGANPFRWRGGLQRVLPPIGSVHPVEHFAAVPYDDVPRVYRALGSSLGALALRLLILTAVRSSDVRFMTWEEVVGDVWVISAGRTKQRREHRVPLSAPALGVLARVPRLAGCPFVFPHASRLDRPMGIRAMRMALREAGREETVHGFRSSFRDWCEEQTAFPPAVAEMALGHTVGSGVERAYRRTDLFEKRRALMTAWGEWVSG